MLTTALRILTVDLRILTTSRRIDIFGLESPYSFSFAISFLMAAALCMT
jgi:hypothetical protein